MKLSIMLKNIKIADRNYSAEKGYNILISNGIIEKISEKELSAADREIDCTGLVAGSGFIDLHCHLREPGYEYKETIETGTAAAAAGGFTAVTAMANTNPVCDNVKTLELILEKAKKADNSRVFPVCAVTMGLQGQKLSDFKALKASGAMAFSDDGRPVENAAMMKKAVLEAAKYNLPIISHCEELSLAAGAMNDGELAKSLGFSGIPKSCEEIMVARECILSLETGCPVHIAHVSTKTAVETIRLFKKLGAKVTAETCPHYFVLTQDEIRTKGTKAKMNPPLRNEEDRKEIIKGLADGTIDVISTDHAPHSREEKERPFDSAPNGIVGLETAFPLSVTYLLKSGYISLLDLMDKLCHNPAKILGIDSGIKENGIADLTVFSLSEKITVDSNKFLSKSKNMPFYGMELSGKVFYTIRDGRIIFENKE